MEPMPQQQQPLYTGPAQHRVLYMSPTPPTPGEDGHQLDPLAPVFCPDPAQGAQKAVLPTVIEEMVHSLHMPKVEMMIFDGEPMKFWTFMKSFDNNIGRHNIDEHAKLSRLLQYCKGRAYTGLLKVAQLCSKEVTSELESCYMSALVTGMPLAHSGSTE